MATKTEELIHSLQTEVKDADLVELRVRLAALDSRLNVVDFPTLIAQIASLQEQVFELKKWREERERRAWQFWLGVGVCALTFAANLVMNLLLYFARKPG